MTLTPLFESAFWKRGAPRNGCWEILDFLDESIRVDPRSIGVPHPGFTEGDIWIFESPPISRIERVYILYRIDDERGRAILCNFTFRAA
jgi:hypothetical protein